MTTTERLVKYAIICFVIMLVFVLFSVFSPKINIGLIGYFILLTAGTALTTIGVFLGDAFRRFVMPDAYFTTDAADAFKKKIFWMVGPQVIGWMIGYMSTFSIITKVGNF